MASLKLLPMRPASPTLMLLWPAACKPRSLVALRMLHTSSATSALVSACAYM
jgi:hypothetical protein